MPVTTKTRNAASAGRTRGEERAKSSVAQDKINEVKVSQGTENLSRAANTQSAPAKTESPAPQELKVSEEILSKDPDEITADEYNKLANQENDPLKSQEYRKKAEDARKKNLAELFKRHEDVDTEEPEDDKFDIQQGDFIDFLMKEVILASAAWAGKKVSGYAGIALYKAGSWTYHKAMDNAIEPGWKQLKSDLSRAKKNIYNLFRSVDEYEIRDELGGDAELSKFFNKTVKDHNTLVKGAGKLASDSVFERFAKQALKGEINPKNNRVWKDAETGATLSLESEYMQNLVTAGQEFAQMVQEKVPAASQQQKLKLATEQLADLSKLEAGEKLQEQLYVSNLTTAAILQKRAEDKSYKPSEDDINVLKEEFTRSYLVEWAKIQRGDSGYQNPTELLKESFKATNASIKTIKSGQINEFKKTPPQNEVLNRLRGLNQAEVQTNIRTDTMRYAVQRYALSDMKLNDSLQEAQTNEAAWHGKAAENNRKREYLDNFKNRLNGGRETGSGRTYNSRTSRSGRD